jgi:hypothetical protein
MRRSSFVTLVLILSAAAPFAPPATLQAQEPVLLRYKRDTKDTLRYVAVDTVLIIGGGGASLGAQNARAVGGDRNEREVQPDRDVVNAATDLPVGTTEIARTTTIALLFGKSDEATAWIDTTTMTIRSGTMLRTPTVSGVTGKPYLLRFDDRGRIEVKKTPDFPKEVRNASQFVAIFDRFFPAFPEKPVARMQEWTDTTRNKYSGTDGQHDITIVGRYRVVRDTMIDSIPVVVISGRVHVKAEVTGEAEGVGVLRQSIEGDASERTFFSPALGRFLRRTSTLQFSGSTVSLNGNFSMSSQGTRTSLVELAGARK